MRLAIALLFIVACKPKVGFEKAEVEKTGAQLFEQVTGVKPDSFTCPGEDRLLGKMECTAKVGDLSIPVDTDITTGDKGLFGSGDMKINVKGYVFGKNVQQSILDTFKAKAVPITEVTCPPIAKAGVGEKFLCKATIEGAPYQVEVTPTDTGANFKILGLGEPAPSGLPLPTEPTEPTEPAEPAEPDPTTEGPTP